MFVFLNNSKNYNSTAQTLNQMFYGFKTKEILNLFCVNDPEIKINFNKPETKINTVSLFPVLPNFMDKYRPCHINAKNAIVFVAIKIKKYYDSKHQPKFFQIGDFVNLRFHRNYQLPSVKYPKITPQLTGPFKITGRIGKLTYRLELPKNMKIHDAISITYFEPAIDFVDDPHHRYKIPASETIINNHKKSVIKKLIPKKIIRRGKKLGCTLFRTVIRVWF